MVCPLCEHTQAAGSACDNCGRALGPARTAAVPTQPLEGLEETRLASASAPAAVALIADLEQTRAPAVGQVASVPLEALEAFSRDVTPVAPERVPDLEGGRYVDAEPRLRAANPAAGVTCRYCKTVQASGLVCERCGMRLPRVRVAAAAPRTKDAVPCRACGAQTPLDVRCPACGVVTPSSRP